jgi:isocitrate dehydrogenase
MERVLACVLAPHVDTALWARFDLSLAARAASADGELARALGSGARLRAIFKEPTITPTAEQCAALGIDRLSSPNGVMRDAWRALVISRDTLAHAHAGGGGYRAPVLFDRHAVGGEYGATHATVPAGRVTLSWQPPADAPSQPPPRALCELAVSGAASCVVLYANPHDDLPALGRAFFERCLAAGVTPYVVTKRSVFKWQVRRARAHRQPSAEALG